MELIQKGQVLLHGEPCHPDTIVHQDDKITYITHYQDPEIPIDFEILYEDTDLIVVNKPPQVPIHRTGKIVHKTMTNLLRQHFQCDDIIPLHRLDRETSGLMVFSHNKNFARTYQKRLDTILKEKIYLAVTKPSDLPEYFSCTQGLSELPDSPVQCQMHPNPKGKRCLTTFHHFSGNGESSLLLAKIYTGRKHQIRAHLSNLGSPIIGDKIYSHQGKYYLKRILSELDSNDFQTLGAEHHLLHSYFLKLFIPSLNKEKTFTANKVWPELEKYLQRHLNWQKKVQISNILAF